MSPPKPTDPVIYKIFSPEDWGSLETTGATIGSAHDQADGFLHFSIKAQLPGTLEKHYAKSGDLILARVRADQFDPAELKWELSRGGALFPHLYGALKRSQIDQVWPLSPDDQGAYALPQSL